MPSKDALYHPGDLLHHGLYGVVIGGRASEDDLLEKPSNPLGIYYQITISGNRERSRITQDELRPLTFSEFLFYTDPATGGLKIGKNKAWPLLFANALALFGIIATTYYLITGDDPTVALALIPCIGVPVFTILGTLANWKNRQM